MYVKIIYIKFIQSYLSLFMFEVQYVVTDEYYQSHFSIEN